MSITNDTRFKTFQQYKDYFAPSPEQPNYPPEIANDPDRLWGMEAARHAFDAAKRRIEEKKNRMPWEVQ